MATDDKNYWLDEECAHAFWDQKLALSYQELLRDTANQLDLHPGQCWLDLGCGGGQLTSLLWQKSQGQLGNIVSMDCNPANAVALERLARKLTPVPGPQQITFTAGNFSEGLSQLADRTFDGIISGLSISYAEWKNPATGQYTDFAYNRLLAEMARVLKPGGQLVFSVNVPNVRFWPIFWKSFRHALRMSRPGRALMNGLNMMWYGRWLRREARRGRFHYLPIEEILARLQRVGFDNLRHGVSYAGQAYVVSARRKAVSMVQAA
jgi:ubiquinone/menaquinone biosynthesis C-methylase UbiE